LAQKKRGGRGHKRVVVLQGRDFNPLRGKKPRIKKSRKIKKLGRWGGWDETTGRVHFGGNAKNTG